MMSKLAFICITLCLVLCMTLVSATTDSEETRKSAFYIVAKIETPLSFKDGTMQLNHPASDSKLKADNCYHILPGDIMIIYIFYFSGCIVIHPGGTLHIDLSIYLKYLSAQN